MTGNSQFTASGSLVFDASTVQQFLESLPDSAIVVDADGRIMAVNRQTEHLFHYSRDELLGRVVDVLLPERFRDVHQAHRAAYAAEPRTRPMGLGFQLAGRRKDNHEFPVEISLSPFASSPQQLVIAIIRDVTERQEAESRRQQLVREQTARAEAEDAQRRLAFLTSANEALFSSLDYETTLENLTHLVVPELADLCVVDILYDPAIRPIAVAHVDPEGEDLIREMRRRYPLDLSSNVPVAQVMRSGRSMLFPDVSIDYQSTLSQDSTQLDMLCRLSYKSVMVVPLIARGHTLGTIMIVSTSAERRYDSEDLELAEELARRAGIAVDNARLYAAEQNARLATERAASRIIRLQEVTAAIAGALTPSQIAEIVVGQGVAALGAVAGSLLLLNEDGTALETIAATGYPLRVLESWLEIPIDLPVQATEAVRTRKPVWISSWKEATARYPILKSAVTTGSQSFAAIPLTVEDRAIGVMGLSFRLPGEFNPDDRSFMVTLANQCALAIERARLYDAERSARADAEAAAHIREEFLSIASHELKTPLTSIKAASQLVDRRLKASDIQDERMHKLVGQLRSEVTRLETLVSDLLDVSRIQRGRLELRPESFDLAQLAREVVERFEGSSERSERHTIDVIVQGPVEGTWDRSRLDQVLSNLLSNALKYSPNGGNIRVCLDSADGWVTLQVSDEGMGMPADECARLFQPFSRGEQARLMTGGTGLGLYITATIVAQHGGTIEAESEIGVGSTFTVRLPLDVSYVNDEC